MKIGLTEVSSRIFGWDPLTVSMNISHTYPQSNPPTYRERRMCHASVLATNTGMSAATKYLPHRSRSEGCRFTRIQRRFIVVVKFLVSRCRDRTRLRIQSTSLSQLVYASWTWFRRHTLISTIVLLMCQPVKDRHKFIVARSSLHFWDISSGSSHLPTPSALRHASFLRLRHLPMTVSPPVAVLCTLAQKITSDTSMSPL